MSVMKKSVLFKVVSIVVILSFIVLDISWAYPDISPEKLNHTLGIRGAMFQNTLSGAQPLVEIDLGRAALRGSILDIIDYVFINENNGELPLRHIESSAIFEDFPLRNDDTNDDGISYSLISFEKENKVITVPYRKNGQDYVVKISPDPGSQTADPIWDVLDGIEGYKIEVFRIEDDRMVEIEPEDVIVPTEKDIKDPVLRYINKIVCCSTDVEFLDI